MAILAITLAFLAFAGFTTAASNNVCAQAPYSAFLPLSDFPAAVSYCSAKFPLPRCTTTSISVTTTTVSTIVSTATTITSTNTATTAVSTVDDIIPTTTILDITTTGTSLVYVTTGTSTSTVTTYTATTCSYYDMKKRDVTDLSTLMLRPAASTGSVKRANRYDRRIPAAGNNAMFLSLFAQASSFVSTVCSCIETPLPCIVSSVGSTTTSTSSITTTESTQTATTTSITTTTTLYTSTITTIPTQAVSYSSVEATTTVTVGGTTTVSCLSCTPGCNTNFDGVSFDITCGQSSTFTGQTSSYVDSVTSVSACQKICADDGACNAFNFDGSTGACTLYDNASNYGEMLYDLNSAYGVYTTPC